MCRCVESDEGNKKIKYKKMHFYFFYPYTARGVYIYYTTRDLYILYSLSLNTLSFIFFPRRAPEQVLPRGALYASTRLSFTRCRLHTRCAITSPALPLASQCAYHVIFIARGPGTRCGDEQGVTPLIPEAAVPRGRSAHPNTLAHPIHRYCNFITPEFFFGSQRSVSPR